MKKLRIGNVELKNNLVLAPMAGYSDVGFRKLAKKYGAALTCTEMISAKALLYKNKKTFDLLATFQNEHPVCVQLFGSDSETFYKAIKLKELDKFDIIDINMGCPAPKIYQNKEGSYLLNDIDKAVEIVKACKRATTRPVTVKFRSGIDSKHIIAKEFAIAMEKAGADAITIHARTRVQGYSGVADLNVAKEVKEAVKIPVIVSGDCVDLESYNRILNFTHADGVMIGRGAIGKPEIFSSLLNKNVKIDTFKDINEHINELSKHFSERHVVLSMRSHISAYLKKVKADVSDRVEVMQIESVKELKNKLKSIKKKLI